MIWLRRKRHNLEHQSSPCSSGKSPGSPCNKGSASCLQAISSGNQSMTAELAMTSKIPHTGKALLASRLHPVKNQNKHRSEPVKDRGLNGSTCGEASKLTQCRDILMSNDKMKHLFSKTNMEEIVDYGYPSCAETLDDFLGVTTNVPHLPTLDMLSSECEEGADNDLSVSRQECVLTTSPRTVSQSSSASTSLSHSLGSFRSQFRTSTVSPVGRDGQSLSLLLEQIRRPPFTIPDRLNRNYVAHKLQSSRRMSHTSRPSSPRTSFQQTRSPLADTEEADNSTILQSSNEARCLSRSGRLDHLNVDDMKTFRDIKERHVQEGQADRGGATAAQNTQPLQDSNKEITRRPKRFLDTLSQEEDEDEDVDEEEEEEEEDMDEEEEEEEEEVKEEDHCRICHSGDSSPVNPLISPCLCSGSLKFIHLDCLKKWIKARIESGSGPYTVKRCELCKQKLMLDQDTLDLDHYYREQRKQVEADHEQTMNMFLHTHSSLRFRFRILFRRFRERRN